MKNNEFQELVDQNLSGLVWDERKRQKVLHALSEEEKPVKKFSATFILVAAIICISVTALAAGLISSPRYDAVRIANQAMEEKYGITPDLLSLFCRDVTKNEDGSSVVTFWLSENVGPDPDRVGTYTIVVNGSDAAASWSNEGKDTSGGLAAEAYGPDQLHTISYDYENAMKWMIDNNIIDLKSADHTPNPQLADLPPVSAEEDAAEYADYEEQEMQKLLAKIEEAEAKGTVTVADAVKTAKEAIIQEYQLTKEQSDKLENQLDMTYISYEGDEPLVDLCFVLWQNEGATFTGDNFTEKDGQYWVTINLKTGIIEDVLYDAGLAGNG